MKGESMTRMMMKRHWEDVKRGRFDRCREVHCPDGGAIPGTAIGIPAAATRHVTVTCIDADRRAQFDDRHANDGGWRLRLRKTRVWWDFSEGTDWEESGGVDLPPQA